MDTIDPKNFEPTHILKFKTWNRAYGLYPGQSKPILPGRDLSRYVMLNRLQPKRSSISSTYHNEFKYTEAVT